MKSIRYYIVVFFVFLTSVSISLDSSLYSYHHSDISIVDKQHIDNLEEVFLIKNLSSKGFKSNIYLTKNTSYLNFINSIINSTICHLVLFSKTLFTTSKIKSYLHLLKLF